MTAGGLFILLQVYRKTCFDAPVSYPPSHLIWLIQASLHQPESFNPPNSQKQAVENIIITFARFHVHSIS